MKISPLGLVLLVLVYPLMTFTAGLYLMNIMQEPKAEAVAWRRQSQFYPVSIKVEDTAYQCKKWEPKK